MVDDDFGLLGGINIGTCVTRYQNSADKGQRGFYLKPGGQFD